MSVIKSPTMILGTAPPYAIDQSIRFDDAAEHFMYSPTPSSSKSFTTTATISMWIKLGNIGQHYLMGAFYGSNARYDYFQIDANNKLKGQGRSGGASTSTGSGATKWITSQVFRDPSAWYHLVFVYDTTNAVQSERFRLYVNGERVTEFDTNPSYGASELVYWFGKSSYTTLGAYFNQTGYADYFYWDGYMAEMHGVDGTALNADSFGTFNSSGIWTPKEYTGSHGTDGFYIKGANASNLGVNSADNGNNFTLNAISSHDQMLDTPTNNFCTGLPIGVGNATGVTFSNGNLDCSTSGTAGNAPASISLDSGKWYYEINFHVIGSGINGGAGETPNGSYHHFALGSDGNQINTNGEDRSFSSDGAGTIAGFKLDIDGGTLEYTTNGTNYSTVEGSLTANTAYAPYMRIGSGSGRGVFNFGQDSTFGGLETAGGNSDGNGIGDFYYNVPSGFSAISTKNLGS